MLTKDEWVVDAQCLDDEVSFPIELPVARSKALCRGVLWCVPTALLGAAAMLIFRGISFESSGLTNRLVDVAVAAIGLPLALAAGMSFVFAGRWLLLGVWPGRLAICAEAGTLVFRLGPLGVKRYDASRLRLRYPFELAEDSEEGGFEAFLPEEKQLASLLPRMTHPTTTDALNELVLKLTSKTEAEVAAILKGALQTWRELDSTLKRDHDHED